MPPDRSRPAWHVVRLTVFDHVPIQPVGVVDQRERDRSNGVGSAFLRHEPGVEEGELRLCGCSLRDDQILSDVVQLVRPDQIDDPSGQERRQAQVGAVSTDDDAAATVLVERVRLFADGAGGAQVVDVVRETMRLADCEGDEVGF